MAALQCEICGGKLMAKSGGLFECEYCGMQYDKTRIREMVQEIKGTVKVEGTVEVKGTVKVDGPVKVEGAASKENLVKLAKMKLESAYIPPDAGWWMGKNKDYNEIKALLEQALAIDSEYAEAYLYMAVMEHHAHNVAEFREKYVSRQGQNKMFDQFCRFAKGDLAALAEDIQNDYAAEPVRQAKLREEEAQKRQEEAKRQEEDRTRLRLAREKTVKAQGLIVSGEYGAIYGLRTDGRVVFSGADPWLPVDEQSNINKWDEIVQIAVTGNSVFGLRVDGTVATVGENKYGQGDVSEWKDIVAIAASGYHTVGLRRDGTVVAVGSNKEGQCNVSEWKDIVTVVAGKYHTVGLRSDGTVVMAGKDERSKRKVSEWRNIVSIAADYQTIGIGSDGTVQGTAGPGWKRKAEPKVVAAVTVDDRCVYLRADGTVETADWLSENRHGECNVSKWKDTIAVAAGKYHTVGLRSNGTVVAVGENESGQCRVSEWKDIIAIAANDFYTVGLRSDGTVVSTDTRHDSASWKLFGSLETIGQEQLGMKRLAVERRVREIEERKNALEREKYMLTTEHSNLKGLFIGKRRKEIETRLSEIERELKELS